MGKRTKRKKIELNRSKLVWLALIAALRTDVSADKVFDEIANDVWKLCASPTDNDILNFWKKWELNSVPIFKFHPEILQKRLDLFKRLNIVFSPRRKIDYDELMALFPGVKKRTLQKDLEEAFQIILNRKLTAFKKEEGERETRLEDLPIRCNECWFKFWRFREAVENVPLLKYPPSKVRILESFSWDEVSPFSICPCGEVIRFVDQDEIKPWGNVSLDVYLRKAKSEEMEDGEEAGIEYYYFGFLRSMGDFSQWIPLRGEELYVCPKCGQRYRYIDEHILVEINAMMGVLYSKPRKIWKKENHDNVPKTSKPKKGMTPREIKRIREWAKPAPLLFSDENRRPHGGSDEKPASWWKTG